MSAKPWLAQSNRDRARHGHTRDGVPTRTWLSWKGMVERGTGKADRSRYYDRGIRVCERWLTFDNFLADMGACPAGLTLDRIDNDGDYTPENCRWATLSEQARNRRSNLKITIDGETLCLVEWAKRSGIGRATIAHRIKAGWEPREAVFSAADKSAHSRWRRSA